MEGYKYYEGWIIKEVRPVKRISKQEKVLRYAIVGYVLLILTAVALAYIL